MEHGVPGGPGDLDVQAPEGFRAAGMSQALMEYIQPLLDRAEESVDMNQLMSLGTMVYNLAQARERGETPDNPPENVLLRLGGILGLGARDSSNLLQEMIQRKQYLIPEELQTNLSGNIMFVRKTQSLEIPEPYPDDLVPDPVVPEQSQDVTELLSCLDRLEACREEKKEPSDWEESLRNAQDLAGDCFAEWLSACGKEGDISTLRQFIVMYIEFAYCYQPPDEADLGLDVSFIWLKNFFFRHLPPKIYLEDPTELAYAPAAISLFHSYLYLIGWLKEERAQIKAGEILDLQRRFWDMLRKRYS